MLSSKVACLSLIALVVAPAAAQVPTAVVTAPVDADRMTARVGFADLNLASARDVGRLESRVGAAVRQVCEYRGMAHTALEDQASLRRCLDGSWADARAQIATALAQAQSGQYAQIGAVTIRAY